MMQFAETFLDHYTIDTPIQDLWDVSKMQCNDCLDLVPSISSSKSVRNSWINTYIKQLTNRKQCLYNKARSNQFQTDWIAYKDIKKQVQRECRKAHDKYVSNIINPDNKCSNKKFWSYIKSKRSKHCEISSFEKNL